MATIADRIKNLWLKKELGNSIQGQVVRNFATGSKFNPQAQARGIAYRAINHIGLSVSDYEPILMNEKGRKLESHPVLKLYRKPNQRLTRSDFHYLWGVLMEIYGESFWYTPLGETTKRPKECILLNPGLMEVVINKETGEVVGYKLHKQNGTHVNLTLEEIYHDKIPNPFNSYRGTSILDKASVYIDTEINTAEFTLNYIKNNASPSGIVQLPDMTPEAFSQFANQWREGYEGPQNAGKTAFIRSGEVDFKAVGATLKDIDQKVTRDMAKEDVLLMFGVPRGLLGSSSEQKGIGRDNIEPLEYVYAKYKTDKLMNRLDTIYEHMADRMGLKTQVTITHESPVPKDKKHELETHKAAVNVWMTRNEVRAVHGLDPLPGGDELPEPKAPGTAPATVTEAAKPKTKKKVVLKAKPSKSEKVKKENEDQEAFRSHLVEVNEIYAKKMKSAISKFAGEQEAAIIDKIDATGKSFEEWLFEIKEQSEAFAVLMVPILVDLMEAQAEDVVNFISGESFTVTTEMRNVVENRIKRIAGIYNEDTLRALEKTLAEGAQAGESLTKMKKRVQDVFKEAKGYRAERIARTESLKASNSTAELVYKENGYTKVQWFTNPGACEYCRVFEGQIKEIGGTYSTIGDVITSDQGNQMRIEYDDVATPPLHPNCTCSLVPVE